MRATMDSFLQFLSDNLPAELILHPVRRDINKPDSDRLQANAINVSFVNSNFSVHVSEQLVTIDIVHENELTARDWTQQVWTLLSTRFFTPKYDYTTPASPVRLKGNLFWENVIRFKPVKSPYYYHFHGSLTLKHYIN